jgi:hypothetical protein
MKNFISRIALCGTLAAGAIFAGQINEVKVTLPHSVTVGSTTLPSGSYTISAIEMAAGDEYFVVRGEKMAPVVLSAMKAVTTSLRRVLSWPGLPDQGPFPLFRAITSGRIARVFVFHCRVSSGVAEKPENKERAKP